MTVVNFNYSKKVVTEQGSTVVPNWEKNKMRCTEHYSTRPNFIKNPRHGISQINNYIL